MASSVRIAPAPPWFWVQADSSQWMYSRWLPVIPSSENVSMRKPISSIAGRRRSFRSLGQPAKTTDSLPRRPR